MTRETDASDDARAPVPALPADDFAAAVAALEAAADAAARSERDDPAGADALARFALVAGFLGRFDDSTRHARLLSERAGTRGDRSLAARAELARGLCALYLGERAQAREILNRTRADAEGTPVATYATALAAELAFYVGDHPHAEALAHAAASAAGPEDALAVAGATWVSAMIAARQGRADDARMRLRAALAAATAARDVRAQLCALEAVGMLAADPPGNATALRLLTAAGRHRRRHGLARPRDLARAVDMRTNELRYVLGENPFEEGEIAGARLTLEEAMAIARAAVGA